MTDLQGFVQHNIEGYLFGDLRKMQAIEVGYPLLMTTFGGVELVGALTSTSTFDRSHGSPYFLSYWTTYLYPSLGSTKQVGEVLYQLIRHGIAHGFVLKGPMGVVRNDSASHLTRDSSGLILVDAVQLSNDFMKSFTDHVKPLTAAASETINELTMNDRLVEMRAEYQKQAARWPVASIFGPTLVATTAAISQSVLPSPANPSDGSSGLSNR